jgi:glycosyltransferase involved in cell wall biosynthesis
MSATYYPPYHLGGDAMHVRYLAEELVKLGHEVHVFYNRDAYEIKKRRLPEASGITGVVTHEFNSKLNLSPYVVYFFGHSGSIDKRFSSLVEEIKPDVIHHHNISLLGYGVMNDRAPKRTLYTAHDYWLICQRNALLRKGFKPCDKRSCFRCALSYKMPPQLWRYGGGLRNALRNVDVFIAPCVHVQKKFSEVLDVKSVMIRNFAPDPPRSIPDAGYSNYFLFVGALEKHKGVLNLLELFRRSGSKIGAELLIVGSGGLKLYIKDYIERYGLQESVVLLGGVSRDQLYSLYKSANALLMPSIWPENSPLVAMESLSVGTPAIVSNMGGLPEIVSLLDDSLIFNSLEELENILVGFSTKSVDKSGVLRIYERNFSARAYLEQYLALLN